MDISQLFEQLSVQEDVAMDPAHLEAIIKSAVAGALASQQDAVNRTVFELNAKIHNLESRFTPTRVTVYEDITIDRSVKCEEGLDTVKTLPEFTGKDYLTFREAINRAYVIFEPYAGSVKHYEAVSIIRNKIKGDASEKLTSYCTPLNFYAILARLDSEYGDKKQMHVLEQEMSVLKQGNLSVLEFYNLVQKKLVALTNKCLMQESDRAYAERLNQKFRNDALRVFISGVKKSLSDTLFASKPEDLPSALAMAEELEANRERFHFALGYNRVETQSTQKPVYQSKVSPNYVAVKTAAKSSVGQDAPEPMDIDPSAKVNVSRKTSSGWNRNRAQQGINCMTAGVDDSQDRYSRLMVEEGVAGIEEDQGGEEDIPEEDNINFLGVTPCYPLSEEE